jgi:hypothetical protein
VWIIRAVVVAAIAAMGLVAAASPAMAAGETLSDISLDPGSITPGQQTTVHFTVTVPTPPTSISSVAVTSSNPKVTCVSVCAWTNVSMPTATKTYAVNLRADGNFQADDLATITIQAGDAQATQQLTIKVPQVPIVPEVSGVVVNIYDASPVSAAKVYLQDSASPPHTYNIGTDKNGRFKFTSSPAAPISPGTLAFRVEKDGWQDYNHTEQSNPGQALTTVRLTISPVTASGSATLTAGPSGAGTALSSLGGEAGGTTGGSGNTKSGFSWVLIGMGVVLVLLGIGAIALLIVRRRDDGGGDGERRGPRPTVPGRGQPGRGGPYGAGPGHRGGRGPAPDRTAAMRPGGMRPVSPGPRGADQTMIARSPLADMPTQLHSRLPSEHADPYTSPTRPPVPGSGYGGYPPDHPAGHDPRGTRPAPPKGNRRVDWLED